MDVHRVGGAAHASCLAAPIYYRQVARRQRGFDLVVEDMNKVPLFTPYWGRSPRSLLVHHLFGGTAFQEASAPLAAATWLAGAAAAVRLPGRSRRGRLAEHGGRPRRARLPARPDRRDPEPGWTLATGTRPGRSAASSAHAAVPRAAEAVQGGRPGHPGVRRPARAGCGRAPRWSRARGPSSRRSERWSASSAWRTRFGFSVSCREEEKRRLFPGVGARVRVAKGRVGDHETGGCGVRDAGGRERFAGSP